MDTWLIILIVILCVIAAIVPMMIFGRWKYVNSSEYRQKEARDATNFDNGNTFILVGDKGEEQAKLTTSEGVGKKNR